MVSIDFIITLLLLLVKFSGCEVLHVILVVHVFCLEVSVVCAQYREG